MRTYVPTRETAEHRWLVVDAEGQTLGRLSTYVATRLMGKHRPTWSPAVDTGDFVVVVNARKVRLTGRKLESKVYRWHTGYPGGLKQVTAGKLLREKPERVLEWPSMECSQEPLGRKLRTKLKVTPARAPPPGQKPEPVKIST
jgi:large subunit ribosomal protein L13